MQKIFIMFFSLLTVLSINTVSAQTASATSANSQEQKNVELTQQVAKDWLALVDKGDADKSWSTASPRFQLTLTLKEWNKLVKGYRSQLGSLKERQLVQQGAAVDPKGLPKGNYMYIVYETTFSNKKVDELVTLAEGYDGKWRVLSYHEK